MSKYIKQYSNVLDKTEIDTILSERIKIYKESGNPDLLINKSTEDDFWFNVINRLDKKVKPIVQDYLNLVSLNSKLSKFLELNHIGFLYNYDGMFTEPHYDTELVIYNKEIIVKPLIVLLHLSEDYEGGELMFPHENFVCKKESGSIVVFPTGYSFPHFSTPVLKGEKHLCRLTYKVNSEYYETDIMEI